MTTTCTCGKPTRDDAYLCDDCAGTLSKHYAEVPAMVEELTTTLTRQKGVDNTADGGGGAMPFNERAGRLLAALRNELSTTVRLCVEDNVRHSSPSDGWPDNTETAMSRWLLWRVDGLALHPTGPDVLRTMTKIAEATERVIDIGPERKYLGRCTADLEGEECGGAVYSFGDDLQGKCRLPDCRAVYDVASSLAGLQAELDGRICTAAEIARLAMYLGLHSTRDRVRNRINQWHKRGRIVPRGHNEDGDPLFAYGEVRIMLAVEFETKRESA